MASDESIPELGARVRVFLQTAPELYQDYERMMRDIDQYRKIVTPSRQSVQAPHSVSPVKQEIPRVKTEPGSNPVRTPTPPRYGNADQSALSPASANQRAKKEEPLNIKPFSAFGGASDNDHPAGSQHEAIDDDDDDVSLLMRAYYPANEELVMNREETRGGVREFLSLPDTDIPPEARMLTPHVMNCRLMEHQRCGLTWMARQEEEENKRGGLLAGMPPVAALDLCLSTKSGSR